MKVNFLNVKLSEISSNPANPRKNFEGKAFDELMESIRQKGVIEPIIVRPLKKGKTSYEVVAGERRFRAAMKIEENQKSRNEVSIPAILRELSDEEAFDFMIIENLQREDLTGFEEAEGFRQYYLKKGKGAIEELAGRIGKSAGYIRRKIAALSLPKYILKAWEKGELQFSHLEELRRVADGEELKEAFEFATREGYVRDGPVSKRSLREHINKRRSISLKNAPFDLEKEGCLKCPHNSQVQNELWEIGDTSGISCLDRKCYKKKMNNFLLSNWKKSKYYVRFKTNGFRFDENLSWGEYQGFYSYTKKPAEKCGKCDKFLTIIRMDGIVKLDRACLGEKSCFNAIGRQKEKKSKMEKEGPRVAW
ncbi:MAG: ParB/RepB/Spo0J family partition protein, partial [Gammaproteobacteria bacterium]|nr:ParB/RepB/Spo0J family partition protein [Gammaproteobacteria bacterium]